MRRLLLAALTTVMLFGLSAPALAHPGAPLDPTLPTDLTHASTDNVEYLGRFPEHAGTAGGRLLGDHYYLTDPRGVFVYDVTTPSSPELVGSVSVFQGGTGAALAQEVPDTDGEILLVDGSPTPFGTAALQVVDVSDPTAPFIRSSVDVVDHTWTCVTHEDNACAYAYGRTGHIVDLTDRDNPVNLPTTWREAIGHGARSNSPYVHDLTEIRPGLVMSAGAAAILMDTTDPVNPVELASIFQRNRFTSLGYHGVEWATDADGTLDPFVVAGTEIAPSGTTNLAGSDCEDDNSVVEVWDAREVIEGLDLLAEGATLEEAGLGADGDRGFTRLDAFDAGGRGIFLEGGAPAHVLYCAHWFDLHPDFDGGGLMAISYYDRGTRFVEVDDEGQMSEVGWMVPAEGYSGGPRWVTDEVVYISDYRRGMEIVRLVPGEEASGVEHRAPDAIALGSGYVPPSALDIGVDPTIALGVFGLLLVGAERRRRRT